MLSLGLLGKNIQKSRSKEMYEKLLAREINYHLFDFKNSEDIPSLDTIFLTVSGFSITAPYKDYFLNDLEVESNIAEIRAVNCIKKVCNEYFGTNTDYLACLEILDSFFDKDIKFFILGDGAMSRVLQYILSSKGEDYIVRSRRLKNLDENKYCFDDIQKKYMIINTCHKDYNFTGSVDENLIKFWDLNYNVDPDKHLSVSTSIKYIDGIELLFLQAKYALEFWGIK
jgi:shikimate dehydrogenase